MSDPTKLKVAKDLGRQDILLALARRKGSDRVFVGGSDFKLYDIDLAAAKPEPAATPDEEATEPAPVRSPSIEPRTRVGGEAPVETASAEAHASVLRPVGYALAGAGVAALAAGITFGVLSKGARDSLVNLKPGDNGLISSISQREAFAIDSRARTQALVANVMFGLAGALVVSGGLCWFLGGDGGDGAVALAPTGTGFVAAGSF